jgi:metal-responsive CopG/Arc/MetJ family transcriptional regulator
MDTSMRTVAISVTVPRSLVERVDQESEEIGVKRSRMISDILRDRYEREGDREADQTERE